MRVTKGIDVSESEFDAAKKTALELVGDENTESLLQTFSTGNLEVFESQIKRLNGFTAKAWLLSSLLLYTVIFSEKLYEQSGLSWTDYTKESRRRLGIEGRDMTEQLSAARFFIQYHKELSEAGFKPEGNFQKLARAELAFSLCGNVEETCSHIVNDSWLKFKSWYSGFKKKALEKTLFARSDVRVSDGRFFIGEVEAVKISEDISEADKKKITAYIEKIFSAMSEGRELLFSTEKQERTKLNKKKQNGTNGNKANQTETNRNKTEQKKSKSNK